MNGHETILLSLGLVALVDAEDFDLLWTFKWCAGTHGKYRTHNYALRENQGKHVYMHRQVMGVTDRRWVDHINGNTLDNRKSNLRIVTPSQSMMNSRVRSDSKTGLKGVHFCTRKATQPKPYRVQIKVAGKYISLGQYPDPLSAAHAYNAAALKYFGEFARLNQFRRESNVA